MPRLPDPRYAPDCTLTVDGRPLAARAGESVASALLAAGRPLVARSYKYHRPRGPFCLSGSCGSCLVRVDGMPNRRACRTPCRDGIRVETQNAWPRADLDVFGAIDLLAPGGIDVHHLLTRPAALNRAMVSVSRRLAGLGRLPDGPGPAAPPPEQVQVDALVLGAGPAGLGAAEALARSGLRVLVAERDARPGGRLRAGLDLPGDPPLSWAGDVAAAVAAAGGEVATGTTAVGLWTDGGSPRCLLVPEGGAAPRLVASPRIVVCTGGAVQPPLFPGSDAPGIFSGRALALALAEHGVVPGARAAVLGEGAEAGAVAERLRGAGMEVARVAGEVRAAVGRRRVRALRLADGGRLACDTVAAAAVPSPAPDLLRALGVAVDWDAALSAFAPRVAHDGTTAVPGFLAAGEVAAPVSAAEAAAWGRRTGEACRG
jgi:sarcosine oxidase, subunit alpha